ncbi:B12-binding domain-containing protein [Acetobacterium sp.]|uniref:cobalamin B12-binding domain-containing protein n=1 Tax=Acetobacterium sp. TaxID=1872094 RepID=UPI000CB1F47D|nr:corrinoid protein [Acetobacterium sp.]MDO9492255.1 corrinoid protein [Acetobacterium sp.]PKM75276.1 MAG: cobalamin-binding protein [Firmicutes bacterium HGW-Firmicutes-17]
MEMLKKISETLYDGDEFAMPGLVQEAIDAGITPQEVLDAMMAGMAIVGDEFSRDELYIPEVLCSCHAMMEGSKVLKPLLTDQDAKSLGTVVLGSVQGDMHDIGKNLVGMLLEGRGLKVIDIGVDVPAEIFVEAAIANKADIVACSALLTTTMPEVPKIIKAFEDAGIRDQVKIMIGGAPITQEFSDRTGCDAYAKDAGGAATLAIELCQ